MKKRVLMLIFTWIAFLTKVSYGQRFALGACPTYSPSTRYSATRLNKVWYEYARTPSFYDHNLRCNSIDITVSTTLGTSTVVFNAFKNNLGSPVTATGVMTFPSGTGVGVFNILIPVGFQRFIPTKYTVIAINNGAVYTVLYSCKNLGFGRIENVIMLFDSRRPGENAIARANEALISLGISTANLKYIHQLGC